MINKDKNGRPRKCTSSLLSGNDSEAPVIFMNTLIPCCIGVQIVNDFFKDRGAGLEKKKCLQIVVFLQSGYIYMYRGDMPQTEWPIVIEIN